MKSITNLTLPHNTIILGDALSVLKTLPDSWCDCTVTSPPYFSKAYRYSTDTLPNQIGVGRNPTEYIESLMNICHEVKRVLKSTGTFWINIGDTYVDKKLQGIPDRLKVAMIDDGWICRNDIIWQKPNCHPDSASDRYTVDYERILFFAKSMKYSFVQQYEDISEGMKKYLISKKVDPSKIRRNKRSVWRINIEPYKGMHNAVFPVGLVKEILNAACAREVCVKCGAPKRRKYQTTTKSVGYQAIEGRAITGKWDKEIKSKSGHDVRSGYVKEVTGFVESEMCNCNIGFQPAIVLDPFMGAGTTALACMDLNLDYLGIEINPEYKDLAEKRLRKAYPLDR